MLEGFLLLGAGAAAYLGLAALALSQRPHWGAATHLAYPDRGALRALRRCGAALLVVSLALAVLKDGWSFGLILGALLAAAAGALVIVTLTNAPRRLGRFAVAAARLPPLWRPLRYSRARRPTTPSQKSL